MAIRTIPSLPAAISLNGTEEIPAVQAGTDVRLTVLQIINLALGVSLLSMTAEQLTVSATNTLSNLSMTPAAGFSALVVNGQMFFSVGTTPSYSLSGKVVTWLSTVYSVQTADSVFAVYVIS